jgi:hypothetical protein
MKTAPDHDFAVLVEDDRYIVRPKTAATKVWLRQNVDNTILHNTVVLTSEDRLFDMMAAGFTLNLKSS